MYLYFIIDYGEIKKKIKLIVTCQKLFVKENPRVKEIRNYIIYPPTSTIITTNNTLSLTNIQRLSNKSTPISNKLKSHPKGYFGHKNKSTKRKRKSQ